MGRCLSQVMKLSLLAGAALLSAGWALSEARPLRHVYVAAALPVEEAPRQARSAPPMPSRPLPPLPSRPLPPPLPSPPKRDNLPQVARISGRVVDADGNPRAEVKADLDLGDTCMWIYTDADGRFSATVAPGEYLVTAIGEDDVASPATPISLHPGEEVRDVVLELPRPEPEDLDGDVAPRSEIE